MQSKEEEVCFQHGAPPSLAFLWFIKRLSLILKFNMMLELSKLGIFLVCMTQITPKFSLMLSTCLLPSQCARTLQSDCSICSSTSCIDRYGRSSPRPDIDTSPYWKCYQSAEPSYQRSLVPWHLHSADIRSFGAICCNCCRLVFTFRDVSDDILLDPEGFSFERLFSWCWG